MASKQHKLLYQSSYDRGLEHLLGMWPQVLEKFPDAELHICYGWDTFMAFFANNPERLAWKEKIDKLMEQKGITHHGKLGKDELAKLRQQCGIWAYPTHFQEINCISALEAQKDGCVPVTVDDFALSETVQSGIKVACDIYDKECKDEYLKELLDIMENKERWQKEQEKGKEFAKQFSWCEIAQKWQKEMA